MSIRRRHFPFGGNNKCPPSGNSSTSCPSSYETGKSRFHLSLGESSPFKIDTNNLITSIRECISTCSSYTQALNNLCDNGTNFAACLVNLFQNLHPYQEIAGHFLDIWKTLSNATASASASVKTETLVNLQDILNRLESNEDNAEGNGSPLNSAENVQILFTCFNSFLRLQALFSCSSWESLDKLTRNIDDPQSCSAVLNSLSNNTTCNHPVENISGHFKPLLGRTKPYESSCVNSSNTFNVECSVSNDGNATYQNMPSNISNISPSQVWNNGPILSSNEQSGSETPISCASSPKKSFQETTKTFVSAEELQDVLDLLSCHPESYEHTSSCPSLLDEKIKTLSDNVYDYKRTGFLSNSPGPSAIGLERQKFRQDFGKSTWPRTNGDVNPNPSTWGWMFSECNNENMFQVAGSSLNYVNGELPPIGGPLNRKYINSVSRLENNVPPNHRIDGSPLLSFNFHNKQPSDLSVTSDNQAKSRSSTQGDSSSSGEEANDTENVFNIGLNIVMSDLVESVKQRRHSSSDGLPDAEAIDMNSVAFLNDNNITYDSRIAKTSTWPLKQQNPRMANQPSLFLGHEISNNAVMSSREMPMWNNSSVSSTSNSFSSNLGHSDIEKYSLFGRN
ncbi:hypothetical protein GQR58_007670 [Nymphon striatum]|nr:hypothetical protein GQR58_007670 [Nymphon striatum]